MEVGCAFVDLLGGFGESKRGVMAPSALSAGWHRMGTCGHRLCPGLLLPPLVGIYADEARDLENANLRKITNMLTFQIKTKYDILLIKGMKRPYESHVEFEMIPFNFHLHFDQFQVQSNCKSHGHPDLQCSAVDLC